MINVLHEFKYAKSVFHKYLCKNISISLLYLLCAVVLVSAISVSIHHKKDRFFFLKTEKGERIEEDEQTAES